MLLEDFRNRIPQQSNEVLYHREVGFPDDVHMPRGFNPVVDLRYGSHANEEALADKYGKIRLPHRVDIRKGDIFEIGVTGKEVTKIAVRFSYDETRDITIVILPRSGFVKTVWFNLKTDKHKSLNRAKYATPTQPMR
jgi:hypothetical protein